MTEQVSPAQVLALADQPLPKLEVVYLAAPLSHPNPDILSLRQEAVKAYACRLITEGQIVFCPVAYSWELQERGAYGLKYADPESWYAFDLHFLRRSDAMVVLTLPGWEESVGGQLELKCAEQWGIPVRYTGHWREELRGWFGLGKWEMEQLSQSGAKLPAAV